MGITLHDGEGYAGVLQSGSNDAADAAVAYDYRMIPLRVVLEGRCEHRRPIRTLGASRVPLQPAAQGSYAREREWVQSNREYRAREYQIASLRRKKAKRCGKARENE